MPYIGPHHTQFLTVSLCLRWVSILPTSLPWCWVHCSQKKPCNSWEDLSHQMRTHCGAVWVMRGASQGLLFYKTTSSEISKQRRISHDFLYYLIRSKWPNGDQIPPYLPEFNDGWQPLPPGPSKSPPSSSQLSRSNSERVPPRNAMQRPPEQVKSLIGQTSTDLSMRYHKIRQVFALYILT